MLVAFDSAVGLARLVPGNREFFTRARVRKSIEGGRTLAGGVESSVGGRKRGTEVPVCSVTQKDPWPARRIVIDVGGSQILNVHQVGRGAGKRRKKQK